MIIKVYPKSAEPYYFQKMLGDYAIKGTSDIKKATHFKSYEEVKHVRILLSNFIKYILFEDSAFDLESPKPGKRNDKSVLEMAEESSARYDEVYKALAEVERKEREEL